MVHQAVLVIIHDDDTLQEAATSRLAIVREAQILTWRHIKVQVVCIGHC